MSETPIRFLQKKMRGTRDTMTSSRSDLACIGRIDTAASLGVIQMPVKRLVMDWKDATCYSRDERGKVEPRVWELQIPWLRISVHRHKHWGPDKWLVSCYQLGFEDDELKATDLAAAKAEAIEALRDRCAEYLKALDKVAADGPEANQK